MIANFIAGIYSLLVLFIPANSLLWRTIVAVDTVLASYLFSLLEIYIIVYFSFEKKKKELMRNVICVFVFGNESLKFNYYI